MTSSPSLKELSKAITNHLPSASLPLPDGLCNLIDAYLRKHSGKYDEAVSDRVQDELLSIYQKHVHNEPNRYALFIAILRLLRDIIGGEARVNQWWERLLEPVLRHLQQDKSLVAEVFGAVLDVLTDDTDANAPLGNGSHNPLADRILSIWMQEFEKSQTGLQGTGSFKEKQIRQTLIQYGKKKPKEFMSALNGFFIEESYRSRTLTLLCEFVQNQPPHLHQVLHTPLFKNLLRSLQQDTSTTIVNMSMTALIMLLPHMPSSLVSHLPVLFNIYARLLFWDRELGSLGDATPDMGDDLSVTNSTWWGKCAFSADLDDTKIPHLVNYFTILYGLYPINFMDYIRKPQRYLRHANASSPDEIEVQSTEIRQKSERFRQCHLLHPNFYSLTIDSEKTDFGRWIKSEPPEVLADCMALCLAPEAGRSHYFETFPLGGSSSPLADNDPDNNERALLGGNSMLRDASPLDMHRDHWQLGDSPIGSRVNSALLRQNSQSSHPSTRDSRETRGRELGADSPTLPPHLSMTPSQPHTQLQEMITSNKAIKSGLNQSLANDSVPSLALSHHGSIPEKNEGPTSGSRVMVSSPVSATDPSVKVSQLYHQVLLLNNDLNFERYLKQQHMAHIGELRRRQVKELATEAETQNLLNSNRLLKKGLEDAKKLERQIKKDSDRGRALGKKWEGDLTAKLKNLREEQKKWASERGEFRRELDTLKEERDTLQMLVSEAEVRDLDARQDMQSNEIIMGEMDRLRKEIDRLNVSVRDHEAKEIETEAALRDASAAEGKVEKLKMMLQALETELQQTKNAYESQIEDLDSQLQEISAHNMQGRPSTSISVMVESALAASRAKHTELQKQYGGLTKRNSMLQSKYMDLKSTLNSGRGGHGTDSDAETVTPTMMTGGLAVRTRPHRGFSDPEAFEGIAYNVTPPLVALSPVMPIGGGTGGGGMGGVHTHNSTPPPGESKMSPQQGERYYGRGVQNALRKDKKDKKKDDENDKKTTGIRGIRRFV